MLGKGLTDHPQDGVAIVVDRGIRRQTEATSFSVELIYLQPDVAKANLACPFELKSQQPLRAEIDGIGIY
jgi:hypothetical protein